MIKRIFNHLKAKGFQLTLKRGMSKYMPNFLVNHPSLIMKPREILIEPTNICNLRCPLCSNKSMKRLKGLMSFEQFKQIIDTIDLPLQRITIGMTGEPLVNKDVFKMINYASSKGINCSLPTNGLLINNFSMDEILNSGLCQMNIAFDGATKQVYEQYRVGGKFEIVLENIKQLCHEKRKRGLKYPLIYIQFLVTKQNQHEIEMMKELAKEIKPDYLYFKSMALWTSLTGDDKQKLSKEWLTTNDKFKRYDENLNVLGSPSICPFIFDKSVILWNGDVALCCLDFEGKYVFGNVFKEPFVKIYRNKILPQLRKQILEKKLTICKDCDLTDAEHSGEMISYNDF